MKLTIKITKEVLERTKMCSSKPWANCAVAYAIRELFPAASVGREFFIADYTRTVNTTVDLPKVASLFIGQFDRSTPEQRLLLPEFSFDIEVPDSVIESIGIEQAKEIISKSSTLELIES